MITDFCKLYFFPSLIANMAVGNLGILVGPFNLGQIIQWSSILAASIIVMQIFQNRLVSTGLVFCVLFSRGLEAAVPSLAIVYHVFSGLLFAATGAIMVVENSLLIYRQAMVFSIMNIVFMIAQLNGLGRWAYFLSTMGDVPKNPQSTIFKGAREIVYYGAQCRPAGLMSSPVFQSLFTAFLTAIHLNRTKFRFLGGSFIMALLCVLSMSKSPVIAFTFFALLLICFGGGSRRKIILRDMMIFGITLGLFVILYPGIFHYGLNVDSWRYSFFIRLNNLMEIAYGNLVYASPFIQDFLKGTVRGYWYKDPGKLTGYAILFSYKNILPVFLPLFGIIVLFYVKKLRALRRVFLDYANLSICCAFLFLAFPALHGSLSNALYWFALGFAFGPLTFVDEKSPFVSSNNVARIKASWGRDRILCRYAAIYDK